MNRDKKGRIIYDSAFISQTGIKHCGNGRGPTYVKFESEVIIKFEDANHFGDEIISWEIKKFYGDNANHLANKYINDVTESYVNHYSPNYGENDKIYRRNENEYLIVKYVYRIVLTNNDIHNDMLSLRDECLCKNCKEQREKYN